MTVNEALAVCKVLARRGYGNYELTNECGFNGMTCYPNWINDDEKLINMEGSELDDYKDLGDMQMICDEISDVLSRGADNG